MVASGTLWPTLLATWLSISPVPVSTGSQTAAGTPSVPALPVMQAPATRPGRE
jgi:hypothetical protein